MRSIPPHREDGRQVPRISAATAVFGGAVVLTAWMFNVESIKAPLPIVASMKPNTAITFLAVGTALWLADRPSPPKRLTLSLALFAMLMGGAAVFQDASGRDLGIDQWLFRDTDSAGTFAPGRMSPVTAICFMALGGSLLVSVSPGWERLADGLALIASLLSSIALVGYLFSVQALYAVPPFTTMAVHTAALMLILSIGLLFSTGPRGGLLHAIQDATTSGASARRVLPIVIATPVLAGWLQLRGQRAGFFGHEFGAALLVVTTIVVLSTLLWANTHSLNRSESALRDLSVGLERRVHEQTGALAKREQQFRTLVESAPDAMVIADAGGRIVLVNAQTEAIFGYRREELLGAPVELLVPDRARSAHIVNRERYAGIPETRQMGGGMELTGLRRDGTEFPVEISLSLLDTQEGHLVSSAIRDVTRRRQIEAAQAQMAEQLRKSLAEKDLLLKEIHHRVKNNMQVVSSLLNLQAESIEAGPARDALKESQARVRAIALLHETVYQSDAIAGVDFGRFVTTLWSFLARTYAGQAGAVDLQVRVDIPPLDMDLAAPCALIVTELLTNAIKHAFPDRRGGVIRVTLAAPKPGCLRLQVSDDGIGLSPERRRDAVRRGALGLKLVESLANQLGAKVSWSGPGTTCTLECVLEERG